MFREFPPSFHTCKHRTPLLLLTNAALSRFLYFALSLCRHLALRCLLPSYYRKFYWNETILVSSVLLCRRRHTVYVINILLLLKHRNFKSLFRISFFFYCNFLFCVVILLFSMSNVWNSNQWSTSWNNEVKCSQVVLHLLSFILLCVRFTIL